MIRRTGIALLFAVFGFASLLVADTVHSWVCAHIAGFCAAPSGPCTDIDVCSPDALHGLAIAAIYFGPAVAFALSGYLFSRRPRPVLAWLALLAALVAAHATVMVLAVRVAPQL